MTRILCILGKVQSQDAQVDIESAAPNSTRWIFDVEQEVEGEFSVELLDNKTGMPKESGIVSPTICPLDFNSAVSQIYLISPDLPHITFSANILAPIKYRVTLDTVHSLGR